jgi:hypothetical protein
MTGAALLALIWVHGGVTDTQAASGATTVPSAVVAPRLSSKAEREIRARVGEWWAAREHRDHSRMYALFEPAYRKQVTFADFLKESAVRSRFDIADARVEDVTAEMADRVRVKIDMETRPPRLPRGRVTAEDTWVRVSGRWYKVHQDITLPFVTPR